MSKKRDALIRVRTEEGDTVLLESFRTLFANSGLSQRELSIRAGVPRNTFRRWLKTDELNVLRAYARLMRVLHEVKGSSSRAVALRRDKD